MNDKSIIFLCHSIMKKFSFISKILFVSLLSLNVYSITKAEGGYMFGGLKLFNYGIETQDLQALNTSIVNLGFSSSTSSTDNTGVGFDVGVGVNLTENFAFEGGYVNYGTLEINTTTTGPTESILLEIDGTGFTGAGVVKLGEDEDHAFLKAGFHTWDFKGKVTTSLGSSTEALGTGTDAFFSVGFKSAGWYTSYDHYIVDDGDIGSLNFGFSAKF